jgi:hypothetical protein
MLVIDLMAHASPDITVRLAHRWPGFSNDAMHRLFSAAGLEPGHAVSVAGPLAVGLWPGTRSVAAAALREAATLLA